MVVRLEGARGMAGVVRYAQIGQRACKRSIDSVTGDHRRHPCVLKGARRLAGCFHRKR